MIQQTWPGNAVKVGAAGAAAFTGVFVAILLLRTFGDSLPDPGYLP
jgi:hypothetical protein